MTGEAETRQVLLYEMYPQPGTYLVGISWLSGLTTNSVPIQALRMRVKTYAVQFESNGMAASSDRACLAYNTAVDAYLLTRDRRKIWAEASYPLSSPPPLSSVGLCIGLSTGSTVEL